MSNIDVANVGHAPDVKALYKSGIFSSNGVEHEYQQLIELLPEAIYCCDRSGHIVLFNRAAVALWGRAPVGNHELWCGAQRLFTADGNPMPHDQCPMAVGLNEGRDYGPVEAVVERPDGVRRYVLAHPRLLRSASGEITGAINVIIDITDRKLMEDRLLEVGNVKNRFIAMLAHELRNPLSPITNATALIRRTSEKPAIDRLTNVIERQTTQLSRLVEDLLDVSRISHGGICLQKTRTSLSSVMAVAIDAAQLEIDAKQHTFQLSLPDGETQLDCDGVRVAQIVSNVLINAAKYTDAGGNIHLKAAVSGKMLVVAIEDNGIGIALEHQENVFELYTQIDGQSERAKGGMGIGLSLVKSLCEQHDGSIRIDSAGSGKGSLFTVTLPIVA